MVVSLPSVTLVASEFKGLAQVGGLGDVVADLSHHLAQAHIPTRVILPAYGGPPAHATLEAHFEVPFGGTSAPFDLWVADQGGIHLYLVHAPAFFDGPYRDVYINSSALGRGPFEDDAQRFAFFSLAAAWIVEHHLPRSAACVIHCNDWHTGLLPTLVKLTSLFPRTKAHSRFLFTVHNLDYQGIRPLTGTGDGSFPSLASWFPSLFHEFEESGRMQLILDPRYPNCFNPMRAGLLLSDQANTVSPTYAQEIARPDRPESGFSGGRGLEDDLLKLGQEGRLHGILNGIDPAEHDPTLLNPPFGPHRRDWWNNKLTHKEALYAALAGQGPNQSPAPSPAGTLPAPFRPDPAQPLASVVGRLVAQKAGLFLALLPDGRTVLEAISQMPLTLLILGTGDLAQALAIESQRIAAPNVRVFQRFDPQLAGRLYASSDLFLMPSLFEPCGISQLIAMRFGTLPVAHRVGGLTDTILDGQTGFLFSGPSLLKQATAFVRRVEEALEMWSKTPEKYRSMQVSAMQSVFDWELATKHYIKLYLNLTGKGQGTCGEGRDH